MQVLLTEIYLSIVDSNPVHKIDMTTMPISGHITQLRSQDWYPVTTALEIVSDVSRTPGEPPSAPYKVTYRDMSASVEVIQI